MPPGAIGLLRTVAFLFRVLNQALQRFVRVEVVRLHEVRSAVGAGDLALLGLGWIDARPVLREDVLAHRAYVIRVRHGSSPTLVPG